MLVKAYNFKRWADDRTLNAVGRIDSDAFADSLAFACQQLNHIVIVEELFKSRLIGDSPPHGSTNTDPVPPLDDLARRLRSSNDWYLAYVATLEDGDGEQSVSFVFADGRRGAMTIEEILFHILTHGSYHRGSIAHALDLAGVAHPADGYGIYIHEKEPLRRGAQ